MAHTNTWDAANEASPADSDNVSEGAEKIRDLKLDIRERIAKDHYMAIAGTDADHGEHSKVTLQAPLGADPSNVANKGFLYTKDVSAKVELFWEDEDGNVLQLTNQGQSDIPAGEIIVFDKDTVVIGYTLKTDKDDMLLFVTKGSVAGGQTGGGDHSTGTWTISGLASANDTSPNHTHTISTDLTGGNYILTTDPPGSGDGVTSSPAHNHGGATGSDGADTHNHTVSHTPGWRPAARCFTRQERN